MNVLYLCDPDKNTECKKTSCFRNGGPCFSTEDETFAIDNTKGYDPSVSNPVTKLYLTGVLSANDFRKIQQLPTEYQQIAMDACKKRKRCEYCGCLSEKDYGTCEHCGAPL